MNALVGGVDALERIAFIGGFRNVDSGELSGAQQAGEVAGVAFIGFERGAGLFGDEGRSGDQAGDFELLQSASNAEAARTGFIGDFPLRAGVKDALDGLDGVGNGAEKAISPLGPGSAMEMVMESLWTSRPRYSVIADMVWLFVRIHMMNQNAYPAACEDVLAALPTRATRVTMNGNHTAFFNLRAEHAVSAVSHKV